MADPAPARDQPAPATQPAAQPPSVWDVIANQNQGGSASRIGGRIQARNQGILAAGDALTGLTPPAIGGTPGQNFLRPALPTPGDLRFPLLGAPATGDTGLRVPRVAEAAPIKEALPGSDQPGTVVNGVLKLKYGDTNIDKALATPNYKCFQVDTPNGVEVRNWADKDGYYFWFRRTDNGKSADGTKHYFPAFAQQQCLNGKLYDLDKQRLKVNEDVTNAAIGGKGQYFENLDRKQAYNPAQAVKFAGRISGIAKDVLVAEEKVLTQSVQNSNNPYFKIYLADVYTAQAMQPLIDQAMTTGKMDLTNPQTLQRLNMAIALLNKATQDSQGGLALINKRVPGNVALALDPYDDPASGPGPYYNYWGGSFYQAQTRASALTTLRNLITTQSIGSVLKNIEVLPPP